jgi:hypothetical protein
MNSGKGCRKCGGEGKWTHVDDVGLVSHTQVVEHRGLREVRDGSTILNTIELRWVTLELLSLSLGHGDLLQKTNERDQQHEKKKKKKTGPEPLPSGNLMAENHQRTVAASVS